MCFMTVHVYVLENSRNKSETNANMKPQTKNTYLLKSMKLTSFHTLSASTFAAGHLQCHHMGRS